MMKAILRPIYRPILRAYETCKDSRAFLLRRMPKGAVCAEIGVFRGQFSQQIIERARPQVLHLIDPWKYQPGPGYSASWYGGDIGRDQNFMDAVHDSVRQRLAPQILAGVVKIHRKPSVEAVSEFPESYFDWVYVDGDHHYEAVLQDLRAFYPKVKAGGYVAGDDYGSGGWWDGGVKKAVDQLVAAGIYEAVSIKNGQFILRKP